MTVATWLRRCETWFPERTAIVAGSASLSYAEFGRRSNQHANGLAALGLRPGDRVAVVTENSIPAVEALAACAKGGFVHVPISFRLTPREVVQIIGHSECRVLLAESHHADRLQDALRACPSLQRIIRFAPDPREPGEYADWLAQHSQADPDADVTLEHDLVICYTSGTTGAPKGVLHKHRQIVAHAPVTAMYYGIDGDSRLLMVYPHNSIASIAMFYTPAWMVGATVVISDAQRFSAERWLSEVEAHRITHCHLVPTMLFRVLSSDDLARRDVSSLQTIGYGSAPMPRPQVDRLCQVFGNILVHGYGMTEITSLATVLTKADHRAALEGDDRRLVSCGRPVFGVELRVVDEEDRDVPPGGVGEIIMRGAQMTSGYWNDQARTDQAIRGGWLHSGDIARLDADGYVTIVDRKSDIIISGGVNIASREVEEVISWLEGVSEVAVIGKPDAEWGERVHAFVVEQPGAGLSPERIIAFCRERLAGFKCPEAVEITEDLPRNALGKVMKSQLRTRARMKEASSHV